MRACYTLFSPTGNHQGSSLPDTGASKSLINEEFAIKCGLKILPLAPNILRQDGGTTLPVSGFTTFNATLNNVCTSIRAIFVSKLHKYLLIFWQDFIGPLRGALSCVWNRPPCEWTSAANAAVSSVRHWQSASSFDSSRVRKRSE